MQLEFIYNYNKSTSLVSPYCHINKQFDSELELVAVVYANNNYKEIIVVCNCKLDETLIEGEISVYATDENVIL